MAKKKHVYNKSTGRTYIYDAAYEKRPGQVKHRVERNKARREMIEYLEEKYGKEKAKKMLSNKDVDHRKSLSSGGSNKKSNRRLRSRSANRGDKTY